MTKNETLPSGFKLTGTISGPGKAITVVANAGQNSIFAGAVNQQTGRYLIVLPAGTYNLTVRFAPNGVPSGQTVSISTPVAGSVQVSADTTLDITLPAVSLFTVSGTVNGLSNLSSATNLLITFISNDAAIDGHFNLAADASYLGVLPAGTYTAGVSAAISFPPSLFQNQSLGIFNLGSATISGNTAIPAFTVPATARLSGDDQRCRLACIRRECVGNWPILFCYEQLECRHADGPVSSCPSEGHYLRRGRFHVDAAGIDLSGHYLLPSPLPVA